MRSVQFTQYGGPEVVSEGEAPEPHAGKGQVRIKVSAASINPMDWKYASGMMADGKSLEDTGYVGYDAAGVVDEVGDGVTGVSVGDEVFGLGSAAASDYALLRAWAKKPASVDWAVAASAGVAGETAERVLRLVDVKDGSTVFIDGGAGGVGAITVQTAVARGARVIASAGEDNQDYLREIGATPVVYGDGMADRVREAAGGQVDAVVDVAGKAPIEDLLSLVDEPSRVVTIANFQTAGPAGAQVTSGGSTDSRGSDALAEVADLLEQGKVVIKTQTFPFDRASDALGISNGGHVRGKLVLLP